MAKKKKAAKKSKPRSKKKKTGGFAKKTSKKYGSPAKRAEYLRKKRALIKEVYGK